MVLISGRPMGRLIDALYELQERNGYLSSDALEELAEELTVPLYRLNELVTFYPHFRRTAAARVELAVCRDVACRMASSEDQRAALRQLCQRQGVGLHEVSCLGRCEIAPAGAINEVPVGLADQQQVATQLQSPPAFPAELAADGEAPQTRRWKCDPYGTADERYGTLRDRLADFDADAVIATVKGSGLRGMGGAGFPTGVKWAFVKNQAANPKYVICNADESEPGTFKDRVILAELPHLVIEGMVLAALSVGAEEGIVFIRHEYEPERRAMARAIADARELGVLSGGTAGDGVLGNGVLGSGRRFDIRIAVSPGGYILGEETALLECLEDKRGEPRNKPPYPGEHGLWGRPTVINNVETFAFVPLIVRDGADAWKAHAEAGYTGLKFIALSGDVERPDVYEVPMGTTVGELIEMAGGVRGGKAIKAIAPGGASSNFVRGDIGVGLPIDFDAMHKAGTMLGSGAVLVIAEGHDIVDLASNVVAFFRNESCGKCVPCRVGSEKAVEMLDAAVQGRGDRKHLALLEPLRSTMEQTSICGLGQVVLNPFMSMLKAFPDEIGERFDRD